MTQQLKSNYFNAEKVLPILPVKQKNTRPPSHFGSVKFHGLSPIRMTRLRWVQSKICCFTSGGHWRQPRLQSP